MYLDKNDPLGKIPLSFSIRNEGFDIYHSANIEISKIFDDPSIILGQDLFFRFFYHHKNELFKLYVYKVLYRDVFPIVRNIKRQDYLIVNNNNNSDISPVRVKNKLLLRSLRNLYSNNIFIYESSGEHVFRDILRLVLIILDGIKILYFNFIRAKGSALSSPAVSIEVQQSFNFKTDRSDLNWINFDKTDFRKIFIMSFDSENESSRGFDIDNVLLKMKEHGKIFSSNKIFVKRHNVERFYLPPERRLFSILTSSSLLFTSFFSFLLQLLHWKLFYKKQNVFWHIFVNEFELHSIAQRIALEDRGGGTIFRQRSIQVEDTAYTYSPATVLLSWNHPSSEIYRKVKNNNKEIFYLGHTYLEKKYLNKIQNEADMIKKDLTSKGVQFTICVYTHIFGAHSPLSDETHVLFVEMCLKLVLKYATIGIIIKTKRSRELYDHLDNLLLDSALKTKRLLIFEKYKLPSVLSLASDISIGAGLSSPIWEAFALKIRGCLFYPTLPKTHYLRKEKYKDIYYSNVEQLFAGILEYFHGKSDSRIGLVDDYSELICEEDIEKVGTFSELIEKKLELF